MTAGGAQPIVVSTAAPSAGAATPIVVVSDGRPTLDGPCQAVIQVSDGRPVLAGAPLPVVVATGQRANNVLNGPPLPVYVVSGSLSGSTLLNGLSAYWKLDEASGQALDSGPNALHLTDNNTVEAAAGQVGGARKFTAAQSESLSRTSEAALQTGDIDYTISVGLYVSAIPPGISFAVTKDNITLREWSFYIDSTDNKIRFQAFKAANVLIVATRPATIAITTGVWHYLRAWHDSAANTLNLQMNNGAIDSQPTNGPAAITAAPLVVGAAGAGFFWNGRVDELKFWKRLLTPAEVAEDYANWLAGRAL